MSPLELRYTHIAFLKAWLKKRSLFLLPHTRAAMQSLLNYMKTARHIYWEELNNNSPIPEGETILIADEAGNVRPAIYDRKKHSFKCTDITRVVDAAIVEKWAHLPDA